MKVPGTRLAEEINRLSYVREINGQLVKIVVTIDPEQICYLLGTNSPLLNGRIKYPGLTVDTSPYG